MEIFRSMLHVFFAFFSGVLDWIVLILVWFERSLYSAQVRGESCPWPLKMTSQAVERTWIPTCDYGRLRGEWVKLLQPLFHWPVIESLFSNNDFKFCLEERGDYFLHSKHWLLQAFFSLNRKQVYQRFEPHFHVNLTKPVFARHVMRVVWRCTSEQSIFTVKGANEAGVDIFLIQPCSRLLC